MRAREMLAVLSSAALAPISAHHVRAIEHLLTDPEFRDQVDADGLMESLTGANFEAEAKVFGFTHRLPHWRAFASVWFKATKKKRKSSIAPVGNDKPTTSPVVQRRPEPPVRVQYRPASGGDRNVTASVLGDPSPDRSALAARKMTA
jgi:hypothetical protein